MKAAYDAKWPSLRAAKEAGVKIAAGSDAGFLVDHGENAAELEELVKGGFTPAGGDHGGDGDGGRSARVSVSEIGTLAAGKAADVVVVAGDPLSDITVLQCEAAITHVVKDGRVVMGA